MLAAAVALVVLAGGCSSGEPKEWSHSLRAALVEGCLEGFELASDHEVNDQMEKMNLTPRQACRNMLHRLEAEFSESDFLLLSPEEQE